MGFENSYQEDAITRNIHHPSHSDPIRVAGLLGGAAFFGTLVILFWVFPDINAATPFVVATGVSASTAFAFFRLLARYQSRKHAAQMNLARKEKRIATEKAIAEMKKRESRV